MAVRHDGARAYCRHRGQGATAFYKSGATVNGGIVAVPGAGVCVFGAKLVPQLVRYHHHRPGVSGHIGKSAADTRNAKFGDVQRVAQTRQHRNAAGGFVRQQVRQMAVELCAQGLDLIQQRARIAAEVRAVGSPDENFRNGDVDVFIGVQRSHLIEQRRHISDCAGGAAFVGENVVVHLKINARAFGLGSELQHFLQLMRQVVGAVVGSVAIHFHRLQNGRIAVQNVYRRGIVGIQLAQHEVALLPGSHQAHHLAFHKTDGGKRAFLAAHHTPVVQSGEAVSTKISGFRLSHRDRFGVGSHEFQQNGAAFEGQFQQEGCRRRGSQLAQAFAV